MSDHKPNSDRVDSDIDKKQDLRIAYQSVVHFISYEGQLSWTATSVFIQFAVALTVASAFPNFTGVRSPKLQALTGFGLSTIGVLASFSWWSMVARTRKYYQYWLYTAREIENQLCSEVRTFERGKAFSQGDRVTFSHLGADDGSDLQFRGLERIRMLHNFRLLYITFIVIFVGLWLVNGYRIVLAF